LMGGNRVVFRMRQNALRGKRLHSKGWACDSLTKKDKFETGRKFKREV